MVELARKVPLRAHGVIYPTDNMFIILPSSQKVLQKMSPAGMGDFHSSIVHNSGYIEETVMQLVPGNCYAVGPGCDFLG